MTSQSFALLSWTEEPSIIVTWSGWYVLEETSDPFVDVERIWCEVTEIFSAVILAFLLYRTRNCVTLYTQREDNSSIERCHDITAVRAQHCCLNPYFPELAFTVGDTVRLWTQDSLQTVRTDWKTRYSTRLQVSSVRWFSHSFHSFLYICSFSKWMAWTLFCSWRDWIGICLYHCGLNLGSHNQGSNDRSTEWSSCALPFGLIPGNLPEHTLLKRLLPER